MLNAKGVISMMDSNKAYYWYLSDAVSGENLAYYPSDTKEEPTADESKRVLENVLQNFNGDDIFKIKIFSKIGASDNRMLNYTFVKEAKAPETSLAGINSESMNRSELNSLLEVKSAEFKLELERQRLEAEKARIREKHAELRGIESQLNNDFGYVMNGLKGGARELILVTLGKVFEFMNKNKPEDETPKTERYMLVENIAELLHDNRGISLKQLENFKTNLEDGIFETKKNFQYIEPEEAGE